jgi:TRAP-type uncharacterized transport system fused permease subunit
MIPIAILVFSLAVLRVSPLRAALFSTYIMIGITLAYNWLKPELRVPLKSLYEALVETPRKVLTVSVACATAGIIIGALGLTGLGLRLSDIMITASGGHLPVALVFSMVIAIVLGMGLPPTGCYIIMAVTVAPCLVQMGVPLFVAHFFVFFYCCYAPITPPVALAAYTTAGIAGCDPYRAGLEAFRISLSGFLLPFIFVYENTLLGFGPWHEILFASVTSFVGVWALSIALVGHYQAPVGVLWRIVLAAGAFGLIVPGLVTDVIGFGIVAVFVMTQTSLLRKRPVSDSASDTADKRVRPSA